jgi:VanZ family protein
MNMKSVGLKYRKLWLAIGYLMVAFVVQQTLVPSPMSSGMDVSDKLLHTLGYFLLMGWFVQIYHGNSQKIICAAAFVAMGILLEFLQGWSGVRHYEIQDMLANGLGVVIAFGLSYTLFSRILISFEKLIVR